MLVFETTLAAQGQAVAFSQAMASANRQLSEAAADTFYVTDLTGHKIEARARQNRIREALLGVFRPVGEKKLANG